MLSSRKTLAAAAVAFLAASAPSGALARGAAQARVPTITAKPGSAMVNTPITLKGRGFPAHATVRLRECGRLFWLAPLAPCNQDNERSVKAGPTGSFAARIKADVCPEGEPLEVITQRICYIGVPQLGEDTGALEPSAEVTITYP